ncbi:MAG: glucosaminidase domain-containing protein [Gammaproteobacteria bacterium]|nr:glucosaminidase domain-containing protein [Gammaproteobacteria bacterium]
MHVWGHSIAKLGALCIPLAAAFGLGWWGQGAARQAPSHEAWSDYLQPVAVDGVSDLQRLFAELDYPWPPPPGRSVPRIAVDPLPFDYSEIQDVQTRKSVFFRALLPMVLAENARILQQRERLQQILRQGIPPTVDSPRGLFLRALMEEYRVDGDPADPAPRAELLRRVDMIPAALVLAQAANESGWGTSRFARQGNNLFGVWTYRVGTGLVPIARPEGETHALRVFGSLRDSVRDYLHNLNSGHAYGELRELRAQLRAQGGTPDSLELAGGLARYSSRGDDYIGEIQSIIRANHLRAVRAAALRDHGLRTASRRQAIADAAIDG